jgi:peptidyl-prolyl cis-trans isomerase B (cyclophilin B)
MVMNSRFVLGFTLLPILLLLLAGCGGSKEKEQKALISTEFGDITILLYNSTPLHRDNFVKLVKEGYYNDLLFHRVIDQFMIQGGDPDSKGAAPGQPLGSGGPGYEIPAEIGSPHLRGALAAARRPSPERKSSGSQFYIVTGAPVNEQMLVQIELAKKIKYNDVQRKLYLENGGYPSLDTEYTVFGEVLSGMEVADKISQVMADERNRPLQDVKMTIKLID